MVTKFSILDHISKLTLAKGKNRYICPNCGGNNFTIAPMKDLFQCWDGCTFKEVVAILAPLKPGEKAPIGVAKGKRKPRPEKARKRASEDNPCPICGENDTPCTFTASDVLCAISMGEPDCPDGYVHMGELEGKQAYAKVNGFEPESEPPSIDPSDPESWVSNEPRERRTKPTFSLIEGGKGSGQDDKENQPESYTQSLLAAKFAEQNRNRFCYSLESEQWFIYDQGCWKPCKRGVIERELTKIVKETRQSFKADLIRGAAYLSQLELGDREWNRDRRYLPLKNGVFDVQTRDLLEHSPDLNLRWQLPYEYDPQAQCPKIQSWLLEACDDDSALVQLLRAYLNAILLGRVDLQKYLELVGPGGTGKSTLIRLAMALVGTTNTFTTELKRLEQNRFEAAGIVGKRLIVITDSEHYSGQVSILKAITGQDSIPLERKYRDPDPEGLIPDAMVIVASNETIVSGDYTSGLARRRLTVPFLNRVSDGKQRDLISWNGGRVSGELTAELSGLLNWVLKLSPDQVTATIKNATNESETLARYRVETLLNSNPIADWLDEHVIVKAESRVYIGSAKKIRVSAGDKETGYIYYDTYECCDRWLYANYADHCLKVGAKVIGGKRFSPLLRDLLEHQIAIPVTFGKDKYGAWIEGITLRSQDRESPKPISEKSSTPSADQQNQNSETLQTSFSKMPYLPSPNQFAIIPPTSVLGSNHETDVQGMMANAKGDGKYGNFQKTPPSDLSEDEQDSSSTKHEEPGLNSDGCCGF